MKQISQARFKTLPKRIITIAIHGDGALWGYCVKKSGLNCNDIRFWCPDIRKAGIYLGSGYDIVGWKKSAIERE